MGRTIAAMLMSVILAIAGGCSRPWPVGTWAITGADGRVRTITLTDTPSDDLFERYDGRVVGDIDGIWLYAEPSKSTVEVHQWLSGPVYLPAYELHRGDDGIAVTSFRAGDRHPSISRMR